MLAFPPTVAFAQTNRAAQDTLAGFLDERAAAHRELEGRFDAALSTDDLREWLRHLSSRPHHVGSPFGKEVAEFVAERFRKWGYETDIETFRILFPAPRVRRLEMIAPSRFTASLTEPPLPEDATSDQVDEQLPSCGRGTRLQSRSAMRPPRSEFWRASSSRPPRHSERPEAHEQDRADTAGGSAQSGRSAQ